MPTNLVGNRSMFQKHSVIAKSFSKEGDITIVRWKFFVSQCRKKLLEEPFNVSQTLEYRKVSCIRKCCHYFALNFFCLTVPIIVVGEPFNVSEIFGYREILCIKRWYQYSLLKIFSLTVTKSFLGNPLNVSKNYGYRKPSCIGKGYRFSTLQIVCLIVPTNLMGNHSMFQHNQVSKKFMHKKGISPFLLELLSHSAERTCGGTT